MLTRHSVCGLDFQSVEGKHAIISLCSARPLRAACGLNDVSLGYCISENPSWTDFKNMMGDFLLVSMADFY
jgi:hypothetical protein